jgi:hypothetical protein
MIANAPPNADESRPRFAVPPLSQFLRASENTEFRVFHKVYPVVIEDVCHRMNPFGLVAMAEVCLKFTLPNIGVGS